MRTVKIFSSDTRTFSKNGLINIRPLICKETKKKSLNGWYLDLQFDVKFKKYIIKDNLVVLKSKSKENPQAFRIGQPTYNNDIIEVQAEHVMFDAKNFMLYDVRPTNHNALSALTYITARTDQECNIFEYSSSVSGLNTAYFQLKTLLEAWQTIEERWGGVFDADNWHITFSNNLGKDVGQMLVYQRNIKNLIKYEDWSNVVTTLYPVGFDGLRLPEKHLEADIEYPLPYVKREDFDTDLDTETATTEELQEELRIKANKYLNTYKYPQVSYELTSNINEDFDVNDKILVKHPLVDLKTEVQEYTYNHISETTENLIFGNYTRDVQSRFQQIKDSIAGALQKVDNNLVLIKHQTDLINSLNKNGNVYIDDNEILILDTLPKENAKYVWRIGLGGFGFSSSGYKGPFETAWTQDGKFNADFIQTGKIKTSLIEGYDELLLSVKNVIDLANMIKTKEGSGVLYLEETAESSGAISKLSIKGFTKRPLYPGQTYPNSYTYPGVLTAYDLIVSSTQVFDENHYLIISPIPLQSLITDEEEVYDEISIENNICYVIQRLEYNENVLCKLSSEIKHNIGSLAIPTFDISTYIRVNSFDNLSYSCEYMIQNEFTKNFALKAETQALLSITDQIKLNVESKVGKDEVINEINLSNKAIEIKGNRLLIESDNFNLDRTGNVTLANGAKIIGGDGLLTNFVYQGYTRGNMLAGNGDYIPLGRVGGGDTGDTQKNSLVILVDLPPGFITVSAKLYISHIPIEFSGIDSSTIIGTSRNLHLYKAVSTNGLRIKLNLNNYSYSSSGVECTDTNKLNFTGANYETSTSIDVTDLIISNSKNYFLIQDSDTSLYQNNNDIFSRTGGVFAYIEVTGYTKFSN